MKMADVDATLAENRADATDHAGHVMVAHDQHVTVRRSFDVKAIDLSDTTFTRPGSIAEDSTSQGLLATLRDYAGLDRRHRIRTSTNVRCRNCNATFFRD